MTSWLIHLQFFNNFFSKFNESEGRHEFNECEMNYEFNAKMFDFSYELFFKFFLALDKPDVCLFWANLSFMQLLCYCDPVTFKPCLF